MRWHPPLLVLLAASVLPGLSRLTPSIGQRSSSATIAVSSTTRLLVIAPHPDDETLGAGGLMQRVAAAGGQLRIVYLTDGDGFPEGVKVHDRVTHPTAADYRGYGQVRKQEAEQAIASLALGAHQLTFLGFPDGGLSGLIAKYWSNRRPPFQSPYTRQHRPPPGEIVMGDPHYRGEDLTQELARVFGVFRPTMIVVPRKEDQHPDHCAASYFTDDAVADVTRVDPTFHVDIVNYLVHYDDWTWANDSDTLTPPDHLDGGASGWIVFPLSAQERDNKHAALMRYESQMHVMSWFLHTFARSNELFSRPAPSKAVLPLARDPCA